MKYLFLLTTTLFLFFSCDSDSEPNRETEMPVEASTPEMANNQKQLRHVVLLKFKDTASESDIKQVEEAFAALPAKIPQIKGFEWGINNSPEGINKGFTHAFFLTFDSEEDRAVYLPHPDHKAFGEVLGPHLDDVLVVDYWAGI